MSAQTTPAVPALHHLYELRSRLFVFAIVLLLGSVLGYFIRGPIIVLLQRPLGQQLYYTSPQGSFDFVMKISMLTGFLIALPVLSYQLLRFIEPALKSTFTRRFLWLVVASSFLLTALGVSFAYFLSLPAALHFFNTVGTSNLQPLISVDQYFNFVFWYLLMFAVAFQLPLMLLLINRITPLGPGSLGKRRKWVIVGAFGLALILPTAPDPMSQVMLALPIVVLYELSILAVAFANRRRLVASYNSGEALPAEAVAQEVIAPAVLLTPRPVRVRGAVLDLRDQPVVTQRVANNVLDLRARAN